jgi:hypothetical protein
MVKRLCAKTVEVVVDEFGGDRTWLIAGCDYTVMLTQLLYCGIMVGEDGSTKPFVDRNVVLSLSCKASSPSTAEASTPQKSLEWHLLTINRNAILAVLLQYCPNYSFRSFG